MDNSEIEEQYGMKNETHHQLEEEEMKEGRQAMVQGVCETDRQTAWLVARVELTLLVVAASTPTFHRAVRRVHGRLTGTKHHEEVSNLNSGHSGTDLEGPRHNKVIEFMKIYFEELKNEFRRK
ncbi:hypothetical protein K440DRAFT_659591 [Wilcoxina mikolae CBS 423.85]|nr:hypothetical protein K440DRAFT_659591 [Wilcoxina mikolae CBS 423.85]